MFTSDSPILTRYGAGIAAPNRTNSTPRKKPSKHGTPERKVATMPTNEERRDVASNLRKMVDERNGIYNALDASPFANICSGLLIAYKVGANDYVHCCDVMLRIADLIEQEPERKCRMKKKESKYVLSGWWACSECGPVYPPCNDEIAAWALQYCPHCGAKVVE